MEWTFQSNRMLNDMHETIFQRNGRETNEEDGGDRKNELKKFIVQVLFYAGMGNESVVGTEEHRKTCRIKFFSKTFPKSDS